MVLERSQARAQKKRVYEYPSQEDTAIAYFRRTQARTKTFIGQHDPISAILALIAPR